MASSAGSNPARSLCLLPGWGGVRRRKAFTAICGRQNKRNDVRLEGKSPQNAKISAQCLGKTIRRGVPTPSAHNFKDVLWKRQSRALKPLIWRDIPAFHTKNKYRTRVVLRYTVVQSQRQFPVLQDTLLSRIEKPWGSNRAGSTLPPPPTARRKCCSITPRTFREHDARCTVLRPPAVRLLAMLPTPTAVFPAPLGKSPCGVCWEKWNVSMPENKDIATEAINGWGAHATQMVKGETWPCVSVSHTPGVFKNVRPIP